MMLQDSNSRSKTDSFKESSLELALEKTAFLSSDGALVNCGKTSGVIKLLEENTHGFLLSGVLATDLN